MKINIYSIIKPSKDEFDVLIKEFIKMSSKYAKVEVFYIFNKITRFLNQKTQQLRSSEPKSDRFRSSLQFPPQHHPISYSLNRGEMVFSLRN